MKIYVGRWDVLPASWEGYNGLCERGENEILHEVSEQQRVCRNRPCDKDYYPGVYTPKQFEETFNSDINNDFRTDTYWIKIF